MHATPPGFTFLPGTDRANGATQVFEVARAGVVHVCKRLGPRALTEAWMRERLVAEGRVLDALTGRGAPALVASGRDEAGPWIVMERVPWEPLGRRTGARDAAWVGAASRSAFDALAAVHAAGFVHGDLSPDNVMVSDDGAHAVLVDFGLAQGPGLPPMPAGPFRGTLAYAAPEVARGEPSGAPADVFALAASLLHVAGGTAPRAQVETAAMLLAAGEQPVDAWAGRAARALPPAIAQTLVRCCASRAADRPATPVVWREQAAGS
jgi:serine/threonine protein kinase